ncbi:MAG: sialate O-acetylesterase [Ruminococcaceae bacterium]|nr:sialate O-acetylesterase [Oscillospiraceae bacterium]
MKTKHFSILKVLTLLLALTLLTGCGGGDKPKNGSTVSPAESQTPAVTPDATATTETTETPVATATAESTETPDATATTEPTKSPAPTETPKPKDKTAKIIILAGQSNAVGATLKAPLKTTVGTSRNRAFTKGYENIKIAYFAEAGGANGAAGTFRTNIDYTAGKTQPLNKVFVKTNLANSWTTQMFGPEIGIAEYLNEKYPGETFYIVKVAKGGVSVANSWKNTGYCYKKLKETMEICCTSLKAEGYTPELFSICWLQGENEALNKTEADKYDTIVAGVAERMRNDFAKYSTTGKIAFIDGGISDSPMWTYYKEVNAGKKKFAETSDLNYYFGVIENGLEYKNEPAGNPDLAHYDSASVVKLGNILGEYIDTAYKAILKK